MGNIIRNPEWESMRGGTRKHLLFRVNRELNEAQKFIDELTKDQRIFEQEIRRNPKDVESREALREIRKSTTALRKNVVDLDAHKKMLRLADKAERRRIPGDRAIEDLSQEQYERYIKSDADIAKERDAAAKRRHVQQLNRRYGFKRGAAVQKYGKEAFTKRGKTSRLRKPAKSFHRVGILPTPGFGFATMGPGMFKALGQWHEGGQQGEPDIKRATRFMQNLTGMDLGISEPIEIEGKRYYLKNREGMF